MLFNSLQFLLFLPPVVLLYYILPVKIKNIWLLISSYYFYMCWNAKYAIIIFTSTVITYLGGILLEAVKNTSHKENYKKWIMAVSLLTNLSILFYYKYINFFLSVIERIFLRFHILVNIPAFDIVLPVGISFYIFQALGYTIDVYRDTIHAEKNFLQYALFVSFLGQSFFSWD